ncbi:hypothetical protein HAX54_039173 [Datura stramonium]|uniref:Uncharacterized protein n=1 Tax=Datura stramonium TaxID=4076 RepID=A0ABS8VKT5_DATST|nr:hypothetical protein [Datura stramonium]
MMNEARAFQAAANLAEIWPFPINAWQSNPYGLSPNFSNANPMNDPMVLDHTTNHGGRKRREDDESAKGVSTSGNGMRNLIVRLKASGSNENRESGGDGEGNSGKSADQPAKPLNYT